MSLFINETVVACIIRLACELDVPSLLPAAFYHVTRCYRGDPEAGEEGYYIWPELFERFAATQLLTPDELGRIIITKDWLHRTTYILAHHNIPKKIEAARCEHSPTDDTKDTKCIEPLKAWWTKQTNDEYDDGRLFDDPLTALKNIRRHLDSAEGICFSCRFHVRRIIDKAREFLWSGIPYWCSLDSTAVCPCLSKF